MKSWSALPTAAACSSTQTFVVDINDIATTIAAGQSFGVDELAANSSAVGTVAASGDTAVSFSIVNGDPLGAFTIDANGAITVDDNSALDFETTPSYTLTIEADDGTTVSAQTLTINIADAGSSVPAGQSFGVSEAAGDGDPLGIVLTSGDEPAELRNHRRATVAACSPSTATARLPWPTPAASTTRAERASR